MIHLFEDSSSSDSEAKAFQQEKQPIINKLGVQNIKVQDANQYYELFDSTKKSISEAKLLQKLKDLFLKKKEINQYPETIQQQQSSSDEDFNNNMWNQKKSLKPQRYFHYKCQQFCWNCRQFGHQIKMCESEKQLYCLICLSLNHSFYDCELNLEKGNLNFEVQSSEIKCLNCLNLGHINCRFNNLKQQQCQ